MSALIHDFAKVIQAKMRAEMINASDWISSGKCKDYPEYREQCGFIQGLSRAVEYSNELAKKAEEEE